MIWLGPPGSDHRAVTLFVAVEITLTADGDDGESCGPVSATHTCDPSGLTARSCGFRPTLIRVSSGL